MGGDRSGREGARGAYIRLYGETKRSSGGCSPRWTCNTREASPSSSWHCPAEHTMKRKKKGDNGQGREERGEV